jgi:hypothetical protein
MAGISSVVIGFGKVGVVLDGSVIIGDRSLLII